MDTRDLLENDNVFQSATEAAADFLSIASSFVISRNETASNVSSVTSVTNVSSVRHLNPSVQVRPS
ncbi:putative Prostaglandin E2 receptor EP4 subtype [Daphnia magna]|uniref:Putative Prostaglandin E2 receptor EP4 subtype n=1 Tax=Daphnia magna TaxID=35525 RepID=A0A164WTF5_9CRUS|nr:putative Prostaglandin E2 receptor EP4 subtype [Daphnia magna]